MPFTNQTSNEPCMQSCNHVITLTSTQIIHINNIKWCSLIRTLVIYQLQVSNNFKLQLTLTDKCTLSVQH